MIAFELQGVYGGWEQADFGPSDQIDYVLETDRGTIESYDSLHSLLKLYDLARLERDTHPQFLGFGVRERGGDGRIEVEIHGRRASTTYGELREALEPFLAETFRALDDETVGDRQQHVESIDDNDEVVTDLSGLYDRLVVEEDLAGASD